MRMTDTLGKLGDDWTTRNDPRFGKYVPAVKMLSRETGLNWSALFDYHQYSTEGAGKSSCVFFYRAFNEFDTVTAVLSRLHKLFPRVNFELQVMPDGYYDEGDGGGSFSFAARDSYLPPKGRSYALLVDAQNLLRYV